MEAPRSRPILDLAVVKGSTLVSNDRNYAGTLTVTKQIQSRAVNNDDFCPAVVMGSLEQSLATWASKTGGTLALAPHNIHIAEGGRDEGKVSKKLSFLAF